jgi:dihydroflavonol-4-reductase
LSGENLTIRDFFQRLATLGKTKNPPRIPVPKILLKGAFYAAHLSEKIGHRVSKSSDSWMISTLYHWYDSSKAKKELSFSTRPAQEALEESIRWAIDNNYA